MGARRSLVHRRFRQGLRGSVATLPLALFALPAAAQSLEPGGNVIIPDGRTATQLSVSGSTTDITTGTMAGGNAYNSFSQFRVGESNTVNLHVPTDASHLVNIVRDGPVVVDGILNGMKDGRIGGNVVFSDSYGFIVSEKGVVNVGSLTVNTPTREFLEQVIDPSGRVNTALGARLIDGDVPLSPDGAIVIKGKVNAKTGVSLKANTVRVDGPKEQRERFEATVNTAGQSQGGQIVVRNGKIQIVAAGQAQVSGKLRAGGGRRTGGAIEIASGADLLITPTARIEALRALEAEQLVAGSDQAKASAGKVTLTAAGRLEVAGSVAAQGSVHVGGAVALTGGGVDIGAGAAVLAGSVARPAGAERATAASVTVRSGSDIALAGTVSANGADGQQAGALDIRAVNDIAIASTAELSASGAGAASGGTIIVFADRNLAVADGVRIAAAGGAVGDGGFVELSAKKVVELATIDLDLSARDGQAGTLLIDPEDIVFGAGSGGSITYMASQLSNGANLQFEASGSITIRSGYSLDTRKLDAEGYSSGNSGSVTLLAPRIAIESGGQILAGVNNRANGNWTAGDVTLRAETTRTSIFGVANQSNGVETSIDVSGTITGRTITLSALADYQVNSWHAGSDANISVSGSITGSTINVLSKAVGRSNYAIDSEAFGILTAISALNPLGLEAAFVGSRANAELNVTGTISGSIVKLESLAVGESVDSSVGLSSSSASHLSTTVIVFADGFIFEVFFNFFVGITTSHSNSDAAIFGYFFYLFCSIFGDTFEQPFFNRPNASPRARLLIQLPPVQLGVCHEL